MSVQESKTEIVKLIVLQQIMLETIDNIRDTEYNSREVKQLLNRLECTLEKRYGLTSELLFNADETAMIGLCESVETITEIIAKKDIFSIAELVSTMKQKDLIESS